MGMKFLNIDSDVEGVNTHAVIWAERNISMDRVDNMTKGLNLLMSDDYLCVAINGDTVDFMPLLHTMRNVTNIPILIVTSSFTTEKEIAALESGADLYARWHDTPEDNVASVLAWIDRIGKRNTPPRKVMVHKELLLSPFQRSVFVGNKNIDITRQEFDLLQFLMENPGQVLKYEQIYSHVWGDEYDEAANVVIMKAIGRLRNKITGNYTDNSFIENVRGVGYKMSAHFDG